jgi:ABC-2 type transport system permease protein
MSSTQGFHAVMNLLLVPMWVLSGAFFPVEGASSWLQAVVALNPMHYMYALFRATLMGGTSAGDPALLLSAGVTGSMLLLLTGVSFKMAQRS